MENPPGYLSGMLQSALANPIKRAVMSTAPGVLAIGIALALVLVAVISIASTAYLYLSLHMVARHAMLVMSLVAVVGLAVSILLVKRALEPSASSPTSQEPQSNQMAQFAALGNQVGGFISQNPKQASAIALIAGVAVGANPDLQKALLGITKDR